MATRTFDIEINGINQSVNAVDSLIDRLDQLEDKIQSISDGGLDVSDLSSGIYIYKINGVSNKFIKK